MSLLSTFSALSKNGYQGGILPSWQVANSINPLANGDNLYTSFTISPDGNYIAIGLYSTSPDLFKVRIFYNGGSGFNYTLQQTINSPNGSYVDYPDNFGTSIRFNSNSSYLIIGAPDDPGNSPTTYGAVYVYIRNGTTWNLQQKIIASDQAAGDNFGTAIAINDAGNILFVTAPDTGNVNQGGVYVFTRSTNVWTQQQKITGFGNNSNMGGIINCSNDGLYFIVNSPNYNGGTLQTTLLGAAYIYFKSGANYGVQFSRTGTQYNQNLGRTIGINSDASVAFIADQLNKCLYYYTRSGTTWTLQQTLDYSPYGGTTNNPTASWQGINTDDNLILGLPSNQKVMNIIPNYFIYQQLPDPAIPTPVNFGTRLSVAKSVNVCLIGGSNNQLIYIYNKI